MRKYNLKRVNVLIVDGNWSMRRLIATALEGFGVQNVDFAADGLEALSKLSEHDVDLVICEYRLGHVNGIELTRKIRQSRTKYNSFVPIILLTGQTSEMVVSEARDAGISSVVAKPVSPQYLFRQITGLIERPRQFIRSSEFFGPDRRGNLERHLTSVPQRRVSDKLKLRQGSSHWMTMRGGGRGTAARNARRDRQVVYV